MQPEVRFCPVCGDGLDNPQGFVVEYWKAEDRMFLCWCARCFELSSVCLPQRVIAYEPEH